MKNKNKFFAKNLTMIQRTFEIAQITLDNIPMKNIRPMHKLRKLVNCQGEHMKDTEDLKQPFGTL